MKPNNATHEENYTPLQLERFLNLLIDEEIKKEEPDEPDCDLIESCVNLILAINGTKPYTISEEEAKANYLKILEKSEGEKASKEEGKNKGDAKKTKHIKFKKTLLIAAIVLVSLLALSAIGIATGKITFGDLRFLGLNFRDIPIGEELTSGQISIYKNDKITIYSTFEEMAHGEGLNNFYYPEYLDYIEVSIEEIDGKTEVNFLLPDGGYHYSLFAQSEDIFGIDIPLPTYTRDTLTNGTEVFCYTVNPQKYQLMFKMGDWYYCLNTKNYDEGIKTIETFKEAKQ